MFGNIGTLISCNSATRTTIDEVACFAMTRRDQDDEERENRIREIMERAKRLQEQARKAKPRPAKSRIKKSTDN